MSEVQGPDVDGFDSKCKVPRLFGSSRDAGFHFSYDGGPASDREGLSSELNAYSLRIAKKKMLNCKFLIENFL